MNWIIRPTVRRALGILFMFAVLFGLALGYEDYRHPINSENFRRIERGMSDSDIYGMIGRPHESLKHYGPNGVVTQETWFSSQVNIEVVFDDERRVARKLGWSDPDARPSIMRRIKEFVGLK